MRARILVVLVAISLTTSLGVTALAQTRGQLRSKTTVSPSVSPTPRPGDRDRRVSPAFVLILAVLALGLIWQVRRARGSTDKVSERSLADLESGLRPDPREATRDNDEPS